MKPTSAISSYLVRPDLSRRHRRQWAGFRTRLMSLSRDNSRSVIRIAAAVFIWVAFISSIEYIAHSRRLIAPAHLANSQTTTTQTAPTANAKTLAQVTSAKTLPSGPTGQLQPPGTMAPDRTYSNNYTRGQCTWYVAGRRQIPAGWGNAATWYYRAKTAKWSVGPTPAIAAIAWMGSGPLSPDGHVALVEAISDDHTQVQISEMNYYGAYIKDMRWAPASDFKYIY